MLVGPAPGQGEGQCRAGDRGGAHGVAQRGGLPGQVGAERSEQPLPQRRRGHAARQRAGHETVRRSEGGRDAQAGDDGVGDRHEHGTGAGRPHLVQRVADPGEAADGDGSARQPRIVGDDGGREHDQRRAQQPQQAVGGLAHRRVAVGLQHVRQGNKRAEQLVRRLDPDQRLAGPRGDGAAHPQGVHDSDPRRLDGVPHGPAMPARVRLPVGTGGVALHQRAQVQHQEAEGAVGVGDGAA